MSDGVHTSTALAQHGVANTHASMMLSQGACGYGDLIDASAYPFFSAVGIPTNSDIMSFPTMGCGTCIEFECVNDRSAAYAVSIIIPLLHGQLHCICVCFQASCSYTKVLLRY